jgi:hypothetical protein
VFPKGGDINLKEKKFYMLSFGSNKILAGTWKSRVGMRMRLVPSGRVTGKKKKIMTRC